MLSNILTLIIDLFAEFTSSGIYSLFFNVLMGIIVLYVTVWLIYGGLKVMKGEENLISLGWNIGKFILIALIVMTVIKPKENVIKSILDESLNLVVKSIGGIEKELIGAYGNTVKSGWEQISAALRFSNPPTDVSDIVADPEYAFLKDSLKEFSTNSCMSCWGKSGNDILQEYFKHHHKIALEKHKQKIAHLDQTSRYKKSDCWGVGKLGSELCQQLQSEYENAKAVINKEFNEDLAKIQKGVNVLRDKLERVIANSTNKKVSDAAIVGPLINFIVAFFSAAVFFICVCAATALILKVLFYMFEICVTFTLTILSLIAVIPIAGAALIYGKWFKDIFQKWFSLAVGNFITVPIVLYAMSLILNKLPEMDTSSLGFYTQTASYPDMLRVAILGTDDSALRFDDLFYQIGAILKLFVCGWLFSKIIDAIKKFLDELVGNTFNFTSGVGSMGNAVGNAVGSVATGGVMMAAKAGVGAAAAAGNAVGSGVSAIGNLASTYASAGAAKAEGIAAKGGAGNLLKGGALALGSAALGLAGGSAKMAGSGAKMASGLGKQLSGKSGAAGNAMAKFAGGAAAKGLKGAISFADKATGSHGASLARKVGGNIAQTAAKVGNKDALDLGKNINQMGKDNGGKRPDSNKKAKPKTGKNN